ncbi:hypothetical protein MJO28_001424 [Puccinia striiformis f. sp. tritici]|uniref:Uncharacterized protein n=2 Tax=Puccinia striiformis f. sp. tritici TaxID=168172 RepID=A0A0L0VQY0_9BASI|nr:hypothetical protein Pst134EA_003309 [Puccinia striiformis f. sp. tritici]KAI9611492.1 hypothetical protein H4Q26_008445 [Puccinia striiformis f. sp. tritici PST-130]KNF01681.1 hypothetical protein PSTG_05111 [Puccinia striiformis f. sp. tritici PST-78]KAH9464869.1 hypothetical protein Pst134EB_004376 [Puccinia striiformis f. sp. tritici]KAH9472702.1 hypothetical protein Pst134EA_003309 [Puccinia striiformis f. sp. tritici]KAI7960935.1 hypothetical protein MJO28_001424 [Puccinia striiformis
MSNNEPMPGGNDCLIKFGSRSDYNRFVAELRSQLRSYLITSCEENKIVIGSPDYLTAESVLMDVFMKYTLEFIRENLLVGGRPLTPPPEFGPATDPSRQQNGTSTGEQASRTSNNRSKDPKPERTRPCDTALNERVIRQQYALYDAAVDNTRKRKDLPGHIVQRVETAAQQCSEHLLSQTKELEQLEAVRLEQADVDPTQRWDVLNAEPPDIQRTQDDFTGANHAICKLIESIPQLIQTASRAINLHEEVTKTLKTV